MAFFVNFDITN